MFLKDARERGLHDDCQSPLSARSRRAGPVSRSNRTAVRFCAPYGLARARRRLQEAPTCPCQVSKKIRKIKQKSRKPKKILGPVHFPVQGVSWRNGKLIPARMPPSTMLYTIEDPLFYTPHQVYSNVPNQREVRRNIQR